jgi:hypothetical protein
MSFRLLVILLIVAVGAVVLSQVNTRDAQSNNSLVKGLNVIQSFFRDKLGMSSSPTVTKVYKWRDEQGEWHFSSEPPSEDTATHITVYRSDTNVTPAPQLPPAIHNETPAKKTTSPMTNPMLPITNPERVKTLIDDAKNIQQLGEDRARTIDRASQ